MNAEEKAILEMQKPVGVALMPLEWFVLLSFFDYLGKLEENKILPIFSSKEDFESIMKVAETIHKQAFPPVKDNLQELAETLEIKPKKLIKNPDIIL